MASNAVATREGSDIVSFRAQLETRASEFRMALPAHITPDKFQRTILTAAQANPDILIADRRTLITACMKAAQDGLLPDGREAALVTFNSRAKINGQWATVKQVQYMPMVYGLRKKILQSGEVRDIQTAVVYRQEIEEGLFIYEEGTERTLRHKPNLDPAFEPTDEDIACAYSVATLMDGSKTFEVMPRRDINKVRQSSQTGAIGKTDRQGNAIQPKGPWADWFSEMARKSVMRRHSKTLPMSGDVVDVEAMDDALAARSTGAALAAAEPEPPVVLPQPGETSPMAADEEAVARDLDRQGFAAMDRDAEDDGAAVSAEPSARVVEMLTELDTRAGNVPNINSFISTADFSGMTEDEEQEVRDRAFDLIEATRPAK